MNTDAHKHINIDNNPTSGFLSILLLITILTLIAAASVTTVAVWPYLTTNNNENQNLLPLAESIPSEVLLLAESQGEAGIWFENDIVLEELSTQQTETACPIDDLLPPEETIHPVNPTPLQTTPFTNTPAPVFSPASTPADDPTPFISSMPIEQNPHLPPHTNLPTPHTPSPATPTHAPVIHSTPLHTAPTSAPAPASTPGYTPFPSSLVHRTNTSSSRLAEFFRRSLPASVFNFNSPSYESFCYLEGDPAPPERQYNVRGYHRVEERYINISEAEEPDEELLATEAARLLGNVCAGTPGVLGCADGQKLCTRVIFANRLSPVGPPSQTGYQLVEHNPPVNQSIVLLGPLSGTTDFLTTRGIYTTAEEENELFRILALDYVPRLNEDHISFLNQIHPVYVNILQEQISRTEQLRSARYSALREYGRDIYKIINSPVSFVSQTFASPEEATLAMRRSFYHRHLLSKAKYRAALQEIESNHRQQQEADAAAVPLGDEDGPVCDGAAMFVTSVSAKSEIINNFDSDFSLPKVHGVIYRQGDNRHTAAITPSSMWERRFLVNDTIKISIDSEDTEHFIGWTGAPDCPCDWPDDNHSFTCEFTTNKTEREGGYYCIAQFDPSP